MKVESTKTAGSKCPECDAETGGEDFFCQDCGFTLPRGSPNTLSATSNLTGFYSSFEPWSPPKKTWFSVGLSPNLAKPVIRLPVIVFVLLLLALTPFAVILVANSYDSLSEQYIVEHAQKALQDNNPCEAAQSLKQLYLCSADKLHPETVSLLGRALLARSDFYLKQNLLSLAIKDLQSVPANCPEASLAAAKLKALSPPAASHSVVLAPKRGSFSDLSKHKLRVSLASSPGTKVTNTVVQSKDLAAKHNDANLPAEKVSLSGGEQELGKSTIKTNKPGLYGADDVARYNELLPIISAKNISQKEPRPARPLRNRHLSKNG